MDSADAACLQILYGPPRALHLCVEPHASLLVLHRIAAKAVE